MRYLLLALLASACTSHEHHDPDQSFYGRPWTFTVLGASIADQKADGDDWDPDLSPPDTFVRVTFDGQFIGQTPILDDSYEPTWEYATSPYVVYEGDSLSLDLTDSDDFSDDNIFRDCVVVLNSSVARAGTASCTTGVATVDLAIDVH